MYKAILAAIIMLAGTQMIKADVYVRDDLITTPTPERFSFCYHGTCEEITEVGLSAAQWARIRNIFSVHESAQAEREQIKQAIALMEQMVGKITSTEGDKAGTFQHLGEEGQLDCIDESTNTSFYLQMMVNDGLIRFHTAEDRAHRGFFFNGWPHSTAAIREKESGARYVVDSWFEDNGKPPYIIPLQQWQDGWKPAHF